MKKRNYIYLAAVALLLLVFACNSCSGISNRFTKVADAITNPSAREVYAREFKNNEAVFAQWKAAYNNALADSLEVSLPYGEKGTFRPFESPAYSYVIQLQEGEMLVAEVFKDSVSQRVFFDLFEQRNGGFEKLESSDIQENRFTYEPEHSGSYKLIIQPEAAAHTDFFIALSKEPLYDFPVAGKSNSAIMSFWGMDRDGGARKHEGIDIFAARGTPVVAATDGRIGYTGERGLGGKQVWLRDGIFGKSLYYAHLDSVAVQSGMKVKAGDTLGFVGNTGNAKFTPPHLHFGIYTGFGAVNPLPYVYETEKLSQNAFPRNFNSAGLKVKSRANLRQGPTTSSGVIGSLGAGDAVTLLGQAKDWLHIKTALNQKAFLHKSLVREIN